MLRLHDPQQSLVDEVTEQHPHYPDGQVDLAGNVDNGQGNPAHAQDAAVLGLSRNPGIGHSPVAMTTSIRLNAVPLADSVRPLVSA
jgi:hypothetical protein